MYSLNMLRIAIRKARRHQRKRRRRPNAGRRRQSRRQGIGRRGVPGVTRGAAVPLHAIAALPRCRRDGAARARRRLQEAVQGASSAPVGRRRPVLTSAQRASGGAQAATRTPASSLGDCRRNPKSDDASHRTAGARRCRDQCVIKTGSSACAQTCFVTPPSTNSRRRLCV
jgi:hypothetical protein